MKIEEIQFWAGRLEAGNLIEAVHNDPNRASLFFGKAAVVAEDEASFFKTLEAYQILNSTDCELLNSLNVIPDSLSHRLAEFPEADRKQLEYDSRFTMKSVATLKNHAAEHLKKLF